MSQPDDKMLELIEQAIVDTLAEFNNRLGEQDGVVMASAYLSLIATAGHQIKKNCGAQFCIKSFVSIMQQLAEGTSVNLLAHESIEPERKAKH
jgi:hypothetical protein